MLPFAPRNCLGYGVVGQKINPISERIDLASWICPYTITRCWSLKDERWNTHISSLIGWTKRPMPRQLRFLARPEYNQLRLDNKLVIPQKTSLGSCGSYHCRRKSAAVSHLIPEPENRNVAQDVEYMLPIDTWAHFLTMQVRKANSLGGERKES
jgi:hypothetical protein